MLSVTQILNTQDETDDIVLNEYNVENYLIEYLKLSDATGMKKELGFFESFM